MKQGTVWIITSVVASGCGVSGPNNSEPIAISDYNELGVTSLITEQFTAHGNTTFRLTGVDAAGNEVALVEQTIGTIPGLSEQLPGATDFGAEHVIKIGEHSWRSISRDVGPYVIPLLDPSAGYRGFFRLAAVETALQSGNITVEGAQHHATPERTFDTDSCSAGQINTSPVVAQCCTSTFNGNSMTYFKAASGANAGLAVSRWYNPYQTGAYASCKSASGGACSGRDCYYGPNGYSIPQVWSNSQNWAIQSVTSPYWIHEDNSYEEYWDSHCAPVDGGDIEFTGTMTGTFPTGQGCPGGNDGAGLWDY